MATTKERFAQQLDNALLPQNAMSPANPFAQFLTKQQDAFVEGKVKAWQADPANADKTNRDAQAYQATAVAEFQTKQLPKFTAQIKETTLAGYDGKAAETKEDGSPLDGVMDAVVTGGATGLMTGETMNGIFFALKHMVFNFIKNIPFVGNLLGQVKTFASSFLSEKKLSWEEAGQVYQNNQVKNHLAESVGQIADVKMLNAMVDKAAGSDSIPVVQPVASIKPTVLAQAQQEANIIGAPAPQTTDPVVQITVGGPANASAPAAGPPR